MRLQSQSRPVEDGPSLSQSAFQAVTDMFHRVSGIRLTEAKHALVEGRLQKLAQARGRSVDQYVHDLMQGGDEAEMACVVDKLTTNETYFFREQQHFDHLSKWVANRDAAATGTVRIWSAASSSGEEAYSIAMLLADRMGLKGWEVVGTDLSSAMVDKANRGMYPMDRAQHMPPFMLKRWCRKGFDAYAGQLLVCLELRQMVRFLQANLTQPLPDIGMFDIIFLRNVLIYFDNAGKAAIIRRVLGQLKPGGLLFTGHAESVAGLDVPLRSRMPAVYERA
jgi:chemotaxis protein methyltransferase CheR